VFFLKTLLFLIKSVNIKNLTSNYVVPEYRVQFGVNFDHFDLAVFAEKRLMFLKFWHQFFNLLKRGGKLKKLGIIRCFILDRTFFLNFLCIFEEKKKWEKEKKNIYIARQCYNGPARPLKSTVLKYHVLAPVVGLYLYRVKLFNRLERGRVVVGGVGVAYEVDTC